MSGGKSVSRHKEASAGGGSFAPQGGLIARHNLAISAIRTRVSLMIRLPAVIPSEEESVSK